MQTFSVVCEYALLFRIPAYTETVGAQNYYFFPSAWLLMLEQE